MNTQIFHKFNPSAQGVPGVSYCKVHSQSFFFGFLNDNLVC